MNRPNLLACKWRATYHWKALNKGYNFALNLISIEGLHKKLWASKVVEVLILGILGLRTWEVGKLRVLSWEKTTFGCKPHAMHKEHYKEKGGGFP
jgi:hypothetical protein